jgi:signal recognition particle subunit SRP54
MFANLSERVTKTLKNLTGRGRLTEKNIEASLREVRKALLEADVALPVVKQFIADIKQRAIGREVLKSLTPGQALIKVVKEELVKLLGATQEQLNLQAKPSVILMAGLQGSGKTTSTAKLARWLQHQKHKVLVVSTDVYRPAAMEQLTVLAEEIDVAYYPSKSSQKPQAIAKEALAYANKHYFDCVIFDTAGRLHVDEDMMEEIRMLHKITQPTETLFVVDSMTGQDAAKTAKAFHDMLPLTGVILTKVDGDARGGAALSIRAITGKPIKLMGTGEKSDALETFYPDRIASRILGMGDVLSLVEQVEQQVDQTKAKKLSKKIKQGQGFDLEDFRDQLKQMKKNKC